MTKNDGSAEPERDLDPYRWLEDVASPRVRQWLETQAKSADEYLKALPARNRLRDRFLELLSVETVGFLYPSEGRYFFEKRKTGEAMRVLYMKDSLDGIPRVVLDPNAFPGDGSAVLAGWEPSPRGDLLAYSVSQAGNDKRSLHVLDLRTGEDLVDTVPDHLYPCFNAWSRDGSGFWYTKHDPHAPMEEAKLHQKLYYHALGSDHRDDTMVFGAGRDKKELIGAGPDHDGNYFVVVVYGQDERYGTSWMEVYLRDLRVADAPFVRVLDRVPDVVYSIELHRGKLYCRTNRDNSPKFKVIVLDIEGALRGKARERVIVPEGDGIIMRALPVGDRLFVRSLENVCSVVREHDLDGRFVREVPLPALGSVDGMSAEEEGNEVFLYFSSFAYPPTVCRLDVESGVLDVIETTDIGIDLSGIETSQAWYRSKDGTFVPMFLVHRKDLPRDGDRPTLLYGYGGFNASMTPGFLASIMPLLDHGGVYAIANIRGGGEFGEAWHEAGKKMSKQNVFDDFVAAAEWLVSSGYTRRERLAIRGGSNGGLLTMATITQRPDLVAAAVADVPVTDMLRFHLFFGGRYWIPDYGNPDDPEMREYLLGYSPYHNVQDGVRYPAVLITTSNQDDRVHPMHAYKMAARLQEANASDQPVCLRVELNAGHHGAGAVPKMAEQAADMWAFIFDRLGVKW